MQTFFLTTFLFILLIISVTILIVQKIKKERLDNESKFQIAILNKEKFNLEQSLLEYKEHYKVLLEKNNYLMVENSSFKERNSYQLKKIEEQKSEIENTSIKLQKDFENIAHKILHQNSTDFSKSHHEKLKEVLNPLQEKIKIFEESVEKKYLDELKERSSLKESLKQLLFLNETLRDEANNLTKALKGESKTQGNWGELVLERVLENSGLIKGEEYEAQLSGMNDNGNRLQADIIIKLPENKHLIIDSKVSLTAYERFVNSSDENEKAIALKTHLISLKNHIKQLSDKHYQNMTNIDSPDFVMLFVPIESSFSVAIKEDKELFQYAWDKKIVIVSPSTLLATLRTISSVWKYDKQNNNALKIAVKAGKLYDKFVGFIEDLEKIGKSIDQSKQNYDMAMNKFSIGNGNLVKRTEELKKLGVKSNKTIPSNLLDSNNE